MFKRLEDDIFVFKIYKVHLYKKKNILFSSLFKIMIGLISDLTILSRSNMFSLFKKNILEEMNRLFNKVISRGLNITKKLNYGTISNRETKRFYKEVTYNESFNDQVKKIKYEINLDKRKLKTPNGKLVEINSEFLAALIAHEWLIQDKFIF